MTATSAATRKPSGTVAIDYSPSMSGDLAATRKPSGTVAIDYSPAMSGDLTATRKARGTMAFEYSAGTVRQDLPPPRSGVTQRLGASRPVIVTALIAMLVLVAALALGTHGRAERLRATGPDPGPSPAPLQARMQASSATPTPIPARPAAPPAAAASPPAEAPAAAATDAAAAPAVAATTAPPAAATPDARPDLSGTWRGEYVDASGKQLLRVVSLSIGRVYNNGGVEGTLTYESASGSGECKLHPRGSTYWAGERRLQLSPEGCSLHYPRELGVPVNFNGVTPRANTLKNGRIEAPTGEVIRVRLKRAV